MLRCMTAVRDAAEPLLFTARRIICRNTIFVTIVVEDDTSPTLRDRIGFRVVVTTHETQRILIVTMCACWCCRTARHVVPELQCVVVIALHERNPPRNLLCGHICKINVDFREVHRHCA